MTQEYKKVVRYEDFNYQKNENSFLSHIFAMIFGFILYPFLISLFFNDWTTWWLSLLGLVILFVVMSIKKKKVTYIKVR